MTTPGHVLLVLDSDAESQRLERALAGAGYHVSRASSAQEVLQAMSGAVDAVVTGIEMTGLDGFAICRMLKADRRTAEIPIVFLAAGGDAEVRALLVEGADCVPRPANPGIVVLRLGKLLRALREEGEVTRRRTAGLSAFARGLAHEINTPLAVALAEVAYAAELRGEESERIEALVNAAESLRRLKGIVERIGRLGEDAGAGRRARFSASS